MKLSSSRLPSNAVLANSQRASGRQGFRQGWMADGPPTQHGLAGRLLKGDSGTIVARNEFGPFGEIIRCAGDVIC